MRPCMRRFVRRAVEGLGVALVASLLAGATTIDAWEFETADQEARYTALIDEFRCPKCLNTNLSGSDAPIAQDLRRAVYEQIMGGASDDEIRVFLQTRYGDFVLYDPPLRIDTLLLWVTPFVLLALGVWVLVRVGRRRDEIELDEAERERLARLTSVATGAGSRRRD